MSISVALALTLAPASCHASVSVQASHGQLDPPAETAYRALWQKDVTAIGAAEARFGSSCNVGGSQQVCHDVSSNAAAAVTQFLNDLQTIRIPSRYATANATLVRGLIMDRDGLLQRNRGLEQRSDADFVAGNNLLKATVAVLQRAYSEFPIDARPEPPLA